MPAKVTYIASKIAKFMARIAPYQTAFNIVMAMDLNAITSGLTGTEKQDAIDELTAVQTSQLSTIEDGINKVKETTFDGLNIPVAISVTTSGITVTPQVPNPLSVNDDTTSLLKGAFTETIVTPTPGVVASGGGPVVYAPPTGLPNAVLNPLL